MANSDKKSSGSSTASRAGKNTAFIVCVVILIAALIFLYIHNRQRKAQFQQMQNLASMSEEMIELEPRITEEETSR